MKSLRFAFDPRRNSLNALRLLFAVLVIISHSWPVGGYGEDPAIGDLKLGTWAVAGFFVVSGYLITMSRARSRSLGDFLWRRALRIFPAFIVALILVAFVFAPLSTVLSGSAYHPLSAVGYVLKNLSLIVVQGNVSDTLQSTPIPAVWNGSLWTLKWEFLCYLAIGLVVTTIPKRGQGAVVAVVFVVCTIATALTTYAGVDFGYNAGQLVELGAFFTAGSILYLFGERIPLTAGGALLASAALVIIASTHTATAFAGLPLAYFVMWLAIVLPLRAVGGKNDVSYGMYIYAFPVQQLLVLIFPAQAVPIGLFIAAAIVGTVPFAFASWALVERPTMRLKRYTARVGVDGEGHVQLAEPSN